MAVDVLKQKKNDEDPLEKLTKMTSIGVGIAGIASKAGAGAADVGDSGDAMTRRLDDLKAQNQSAMDNSIFSDTPKMPKSRFGLGMKY